VKVCLCGRSSTREQGKFVMGSGWGELPMVQILSKDENLENFRIIVWNMTQFLDTATRLYQLVWQDRGLRQLPERCGLCWFGDVSDAALVALRDLMWRKALPGEDKFVMIAPPRPLETSSLKFGAEQTDPFAPKDNVYADAFQWCTPWQPQELTASSCS